MDKNRVADMFNRAKDDVKPVGMQHGLKVQSALRTASVGAKDGAAVVLGVAAYGAGKAIGWAGSFVKGLRA